MTDSRRHTAQRAGLAVATFVVVALVAGSATLLISQDSSDASSDASPVTSTTPSASASVSPSVEETELANRKSDTLDHEDNGNFWIWAPPAVDGKRLMSVNAEGTLDLSRKSKKVTDYLGYRGEMLLLAVPGIDDLWIFQSPVDSEEADSFCVTVGEAGFLLEICDADDEKQQFTIARPDGEDGYTIYSVARKAYLKSEGRAISWSETLAKATRFAFEAKPID